MKKLLKPASIVFYILTALVFFLLGLFFAGAIEAGKNQGLAGGAIVLGYGVLFGGLAFISSFIIAYHVVHKWIVRLNWILLLLLGIGYGITHYRYLQRNQKQMPSENERIERSTTAPISMLTPAETYTRMTLLPKKTLVNNLDANEIGLGFFKPNFYEYPQCYFYGNINWEKGVAEHLPQDSISLQQDPSGGFLLKSAPPYLWPEYHHTPHGEFYFKVIAEGHDFAKVVVNQKTGQITYLDKTKGTLLHWPEFLLKLNAITLLAEYPQSLRLKPLAHSELLSETYERLIPLAVQGDWLQVAARNDKQQTSTQGWVRWRDHEKLLITYHISE